MFKKALCVTFDWETIACRSGAFTVQAGPITTMLIWNGTTNYITYTTSIPPFRTPNLYAYT